jgi:hypothetical protein
LAVNDFSLDLICGPGALVALRHKPVEDGERYLEPLWNYLFFLGGDFGFPASLRFFLHVPSSLRARGSLPTYGPCLDPALRSAISRSSYPCFLTCLALASLKAIRLS